MDTSSFCVGSKSRAPVLKKLTYAWRPAATLKRPLPGVSTRKTTGPVPGFKANQGARVKLTEAYKDRFCRRSSDCTLRPARGPSALGAALSVGEPASGAYADPTGPPERENPNALVGWTRLKMRRFAAYAVASSRKSNIDLRIWRKRSKSTSRGAKLSADARCWTRSRASVSKPLRSSQVNSDLLKSLRARVRRPFSLRRSAQALYLVTESRAPPSEAILKCRKLEMPSCVEQCTFQLRKLSGSTHRRELRRTSQGERKGEDGRHWGRNAETPAHLMRDGRIRLSLRRFPASWGLMDLTLTTAFVRGVAQRGRHLTSTRYRKIKCTVPLLSPPDLSPSWNGRRFSSHDARSEFPKPDLSDQ